ncbi:hypothetical protein ACPXAO_24530, partial [Salmonella enterica]|uniref:hypothetical protein n=1 Tax=Salmonella enterica TaxID=28901 RepID=UPI003CF22649
KGTTSLFDERWRIARQSAAGMSDRDFAYYDGLATLKTITFAGGSRSLDYDSNGHLFHSTDPRNGVTTFTYDDDGHTKT